MSDVLSEVVRQSAVVSRVAQHVRVADSSALNAIAEQLREALQQHTPQADALPLHFAHDAHRVNFHAVQCLLEIGRQENH